MHPMLGTTPTSDTVSASRCFTLVWRTQNLLKSQLSRTAELVSAGVSMIEKYGMLSTLLIGCKLGFVGSYNDYYIHIIYWNPCICFVDSILKITRGHKRWGFVKAWGWLPCTLQEGDVSSRRFRVWFECDGTRLSPWHDIPLRNADGSYNFVCEIPKWTRKNLGGHQRGHQRFIKIQSGSTYIVMEWWTA